MKRSGLIAAGLTTLALVCAHVASAGNWYVTVGGTGNGSSWASPTNSIQGAIDASTVGDTVWVGNGVYDTGSVTGWPVGSSLPNRIAIWKPITVRSANNDPASTIIKGAGPNGPSAVRCVYMTNLAVLSGFTLRDGATLTAGAVDGDVEGGGVFCEFMGGNVDPAIVSNCVFTANSAQSRNGATRRGVYYNCQLIGNKAVMSGGAGDGSYYNCTIANNYVTHIDGAGGALFQARAQDCTIANNYTVGNGDGGGVFYSAVYNSTIRNNYAAHNGGAGKYSSMYNCMIVSNSAGAHGGAVVGHAWDTYAKLYNCAVIGNVAGGHGGAALGDCRLYNSTFVGNSAANGGGMCGDFGSGEGIKLSNCIIYFNTASVSGPNYDAGPIEFTYCDTFPAQGGWAAGNITDEPLFVDAAAGNYRLTANSPCVNAGINGWWTDPPTDTDLDGGPRIRYGTADMGAYEFYALHTGTLFLIH